MMPELQQNEQPVDEHDGIDLRGTLFSVTVVGIIIIIFWVGVWALFLSR